jgi:hypothetical protein
MVPDVAALAAISLVDDLARDEPGAVALAELASIATRVEPSLVRQLRLEIEPGLTADAEGDLWLGPLVESRSPRGFVMRADVVDVLRTRLASRPERLECARTVVAAQHASAPASVRLEEEIVWRALRPDAGEQGPAIQESLRSAMKAMVDDPARTKDVARWAVRALPRLPANVRDSVSAWMLALSAGAQLDGRSVLAGDAPAGALEGVQGLLPTATASAPVGARLVGGEVELSSPPDPRSPEIHVPETNPLLVSVESSGGTGTQVSLRVGETRGDRRLVCPVRLHHRDDRRASRHRESAQPHR